MSTGGKMCQLSRATTAIILLAHCLVGAFLMYKWPFDGVCASDDTLTLQGVARAGQKGVTDMAVYQYCSEVINERDTLGIQLIRTTHTRTHAHAHSHTHTHTPHNTTHARTHTHATTR